MKKLLLLVVIISASQLSFATDTPSAASPALSSFNGNFSTATDIQWQRSAACEKVSFVLDNRFLNAFYTPDGELMAITRNIISEQLPLKLLLELKKDYCGFWISDLFEVVNESGDQYYITLENADEKLVLKAKANKSWKLYSKAVKL
jgi:hypothetical protein